MFPPKHVSATRVLRTAVSAPGAVFAADAASLAFQARGRTTRLRMGRATIDNDKSEYSYSLAVNPSDLHPGATVGGPKWSEMVHIHGVERVGPYVRVTGMTAVSRTAVDDILALGDVRQVTPAEGAADGAGSPERMFLAVEAMRYAFASYSDPLWALHSSAVDPLPHQIEAAYSYVLRWPRIRFMLAHDAGTGKTVTAGLVVKELWMRRNIRRVLVVAPAGLHGHWQRELKKLGLDSGTGGPAGIRARPDTYITVASPDLVERADIMPYLESSPPDMVVVDEAHALPLRATPKGGRPLAESLSGLSAHLLLLTASPPPESSARFRRMLDMLEPGFLADPQMTQEAMDSADNPLFLRRTAGTLKGFGGDSLFGVRRIRSVYVAPSEVEGILYAAVSDYMRGRCRRTPAGPSEVSGCMASGVYALLRGLERRRRDMEDTLHDYPGGAPRDGAEDDEAETKSLDRMIAMARRVLDSGSERKIKTLHDALKEFGGKKTLVIVDSADTLRYVEEKIRSWNHAVCTIHDGMAHPDRMAAEAAFRRDADVMVSCGTPGDDMNIQFCGRMINYDIPRDPAVLARRVACLRRYKNTQDITILNILVDATPEGVVMRRFLQGLEKMKDGAMFDVAGDVVDGGALAGMVADAAAGVREPGKIADDLQTAMDEWYHADGGHAPDVCVAAKPLDIEALSRMVEDSRPHKAAPEYTRDVFARALDILGGRLRRRPDGLDALDYIPPELRQAAGRALPDRCLRVSFDASRDAEMVVPGHPVFEAVMEWIAQNCTADARRGALFTDPDGAMDGYLLFHHLDIRDRTGVVAGRRMACHFFDQVAGTVTNRHPTILWDLQRGGDQAEGAQRRAAEARAAESVFAVAERYRDELLMERRRQAGVRERYGLASLDGIIRGLAKEMASGDAADRPDVLKRHAAYVEYRRRLESRMAREQELVIRTPRLVAWARVVPGSTEPPDPRLRVAGVAASMAYERRCGRLPVNVYGQSMGYDIVSRDARGRARYVAVRAREGRGGVSMTPNEMRVARNTGSDYYLYVVYGGEADPVRIPDPGHALRMNRGDIRHAVSEDQIRLRAES